jgi:SNF2 family DNA or RNA helicase
MVWHVDLAECALQADIAAFQKREKVRRKGGPMASSQHLSDAVPDFLNGRKLRDYQIESLHWMIQNLRRKINCILGDEMVRVVIL